MFLNSKGRERWKKYIWLIIIFIVLFKVNSFSLSGSIVVNTVWKDDITITGPLTIEEGVVLTIKPGVTVSVVEGQSYEIIVKGIIDSRGTVAEPVVIKTISGSSFWKGITVGANNVNIYNLSIQNASIGININSYSNCSIKDVDFVSCNYAVLADSSDNLLISNSDITESDYAINLSGINQALLSNVKIEKAQTGLILDDIEKLKIYNTSINGNSVSALKITNCDTAYINALMIDSIDGFGALISGDLADQTNVRIVKSTISNCDSTGIFIDGYSKVNMDSCNIVRNQYGGIVVRATDSAMVEINGCNLQENYGYRKVAHRELRTQSVSFYVGTSTASTSLSETYKYYDYIPAGGTDYAMSRVYASYRVQKYSYYNSDYGYARSSSRTLFSGYNIGTGSGWYSVGSQDTTMSISFSTAYGTFGGYVSVSQLEYYGTYEYDTNFVDILNLSSKGSVNASGNYWGGLIPANRVIGSVNTISELASGNSSAGYVDEEYSAYYFAPNGGNDVFPNDSFEITWPSFDTTTSVKIQYTINGGANWGTITTSTENDGFYKWEVPNIITDVFKVRILNPVSDSVIKVSAVNIPIGNGKLDVVSPDKGNESWIGGTTEEIRWESAGDVGNLILHYSIDSGSTWKLIDSNIVDDSSFSWIIPDDPTSNCFVRITSQKHPEINDICDAVFTIEPTPRVDVTSPNGGESWIAGTTHEITWNSVNLKSGVTIEYSHDSGVSWYTVSDNTPDDGSFDWMVPDSISGKCLVRVSEEQDGEPIDTSDSFFTIATPVITLNSPNNGEILFKGELYNITWANTGTVGDVKLEYSIDSGSSWSLIIPAVTNTESYGWIAPDVNSQKCIIRVSDVNNIAIIDRSDSLFTITDRPAITVISPNGGESLTEGETDTIKWNSIGTVGRVAIEYSVDNRATWKSIVNGTENDGEYVWDIPRDPSVQCFVRVFDSLFVDVCDTSAIAFNMLVAPKITITSPNGGEEWERDNAYDITWNTEGVVGNVSLYYSVDNKVTWNMIIASTANDGVYSWTIPDEASTECFIRIAELSDGLPNDTSDVEFEMFKPTLTVVSPNGSEFLNSGDLISISWTSRGAVGNVKLDYSIDSGNVWSEIVANTTNDGNYNWTIPSISSGKCLLKVTDIADTSITDKSDSLYTISMPINLTLKSPNGSEALKGGDNYNITWENDGVINNVKLEYSLDNGISWSLISDNEVNDSLYEWVVPNITSSEALVRVVDLRSSIADTSDASFSISFTEDLPAEIIKDPLSQTHYRKETAQFFIEAKGDSVIVYQWQKNGVNLDNTNNDTLIISILSFSDTGSYRCIVSNGNGADTSLAAILTIENRIPLFTSITSQSVKEDSSIIITMDMTDAVDNDNDSLKLIIEDGTNYAVSGLTILPENNYNGNLTVPVKVTDGFDTSSIVNLLVAVESVNDVPVIDIPFNDTIISIGDYLDYTVDASNFIDIDTDDNILVTVSGLNSDFIYDAGSITGVSSEVCTLFVIVTAEDDSMASVSDTFTIVVDNTTEITEEVDYNIGIGKFTAAPNLVTQRGLPVHFVIPEKINGEGTITVIDYLGDVVEHKNVLLRNGGHYKWDLRNRNGVSVASGSYIAILKVTDEFGSTKVYKTQIGIQVE